MQRPLWASTGTKNAEYPDTMYVDQLVVADVVNTMPEKTLLASFDHARLPAGEGAFDTVTGAVTDAQATLEAVVRVGVPYEEIIATLTREGVDSFIASWENLLGTVTAALQDAA